MITPVAEVGFVPWTWVDAQLQAARTIWLGTTRRDGRPHAVPVWFVWDGRTLYFLTDRRGQKAKNLGHQAGVVMHLADGDHATILHGRASVVGDPAEKSQVDFAYGLKYVDPKTGARAGVNGSDDVLFRVDVRHVMTWAYGDVASRTDWRLQ